MQNLKDYFSIPRMSPEGLAHQSSLHSKASSIRAWNQDLQARNGKLVMSFERWMRRDGNSLGKDPMWDMSARKDEDVNYEAKIVPRTEEEQREAEKVRGRAEAK